MKGIVLWLVLASVFVVGCGIGYAAGSGTNPQTGQPVRSVQSAPANNTTAATQLPAQPTAVQSRTSFGDGTWRVGTDIEPGSYRTGSGNGCYWARLKGFTGITDVLANGLPTGPAVVTILPTDAGFESRRCGTWTKQ